MRVRRIDYQAFNEETAPSLSHLLWSLPPRDRFFPPRAASIIFFHVSTEVNENVNSVMHMRTRNPAKHIFKLHWKKLRLNGLVFITEINKIN